LFYNQLRGEKMAKMLKKKKSSKEANLKRPTAKQRFKEKLKSGDIGELHLYRMEKLKNYCDDQYLSRKERTERKSALLTLLTKKTGSLKPMYLYGSGSAYEWDKIMCHIDPSIKQSDLVKILIDWPLFKDKLAGVSSSLQNILKGLNKLSNKELSLIETIINHTIKLNEISDH